MQMNDRNMHTYPKVSAGCLAALFLCLSLVNLSAQTSIAPADLKPEQVAADLKPEQVAAPAEKTNTAKEEVLQLNPFIVTGSEDRGYASSATLSGSRLDTQSKYLAASITEVNQTMMRDLGTFQMNEVMDFTPNAMSYDNGRSGGLTDLNQNGSITGSFRSSIRGSIVGSTSRDFLGTRVPDDAYNTDRISVNRGPNSILFGLGSPQGIVNAVSSWPEMKNKYKISTLIDNWGSHRETFKLNQEIIKGKTAIILAGLNEDKQTIMKPSDRLSRRLYGAITIKPLKDTTIRANFENGQMRAAAARPWPVDDGLSTWRKAGANEVPPELEAGGARFGSSLTLSPAQTAQLPALAAQLTQLGFQLGPAGTNSRPTVILNSNSAMPYTNSLGEAVSRYNLGVGVANVQNFTLVDSPIPYTVNTAGWSTGFRQNWQSHMVIVDQAIGKNLFIQGIFNRVNSDFIVNNSAPLPQNTLQIDKNELVADIYGNVIKNPNYNRYYVGYFNSGIQHSYIDDENALIQAAYTLDLRNRFHGAWGEILGHHKFLALGQRSSSDIVFLISTPRNMYPDALAGKLPQANPAYFTSIANQNNQILEVKSYIDPKDSSTWAMRDILTDVWGQYQELWHDSALPARNASGVTPGWVVQSANRNYQIIDSQVVVMQNYFWKDRIALTLGLRKDTSKVTSMATGATSAVKGMNGLDNFVSNIYLADRIKGNAAYPTTTYEQVGRTKTLGVVVHPLPWLGFFFNESDNFNSIGSAANVDVFGRILPPSSALGRDWGIRMELLKGKVYLNVSRYTMKQENVPNGFFKQTFGGSFVGENVRVTLSQELFNQTGKQEFLFRPWVSPSQQQFWNGTGGVEEYGYEASLTANPTPNWRITASFSKQFSASAGYGGVEQEWHDWALDFVKKNYPATLDVSTLVGQRGVPETLRQDFEDIQTTINQMQSLAGRRDSRQPEYTGTLITGYDFTHGWLKGTSIGGNYRYRGRQAIGYAFKTGSKVLFDADKPFYGPVRCPIGVFAAYTFKMPGRTKCRVQVNADNINFNDQLYPFLETDDGNGNPLVVKYAVGQGTTYAASVTFDF